jgi:hypothetical protein
MSNKIRANGSEEQLKPAKTNGGSSVADKAENTGKPARSRKKRKPQMMENLHNHLHYFSSIAVLAAGAASLLRLC